MTRCGRTLSLDPMLDQEMAVMNRKDHLLVIMAHCDKMCCGKTQTPVACKGKEKKNKMCFLLCDAGIFFLDILHLFRVVLKKPVCSCFVSLPGQNTRHYECKK